MHDTSILHDAEGERNPPSVADMLADAYRVERDELRAQLEAAIRERCQFQEALHAVMDQLAVATRDLRRQAAALKHATFELRRLHQEAAGARGRSRAA